MPKKINDGERLMHCTLHDDHFYIWTGFYKTFKTISKGEIRISPTDSGFLAIYIEYEGPYPLGMTAAVYHDRAVYCNIHRRDKETRDAILEAVSWVLGHND